MGCAEESNFEDLISDASHNKENQALLGNFKNWEDSLGQEQTTKEVNKEAKVVRFPIKRVLQLAASIALILTTWIVITLNSSSDLDRLFADNFAPFPNERTFRGNESNATPNRKRCLPIL